jgi:hypothetical protein
VTQQLLLLLQQLPLGLLHAHQLLWWLLLQLHHRQRQCQHQLHGWLWVLRRSLLLPACTQLLLPLLPEPF